MGRLDQGHLHSKLAPRMRKEFSESMLIAIQNIYIWARNMAPTNACGYMNIHEQS